MRKAILRVSALLCIFVMLSCGANTSKNDRENRNESGMILQEGVSSDGAKSMQSSKAENKFTFRGGDYTAVVHRYADAGLPRVKSEMGDVYTDNKIELTITRGGAPFFSKTFTKQDFVSVADAAFMKNSILEWMVYNRTSSQGILFAASICYPQTDLYLPISITIGADGKVSMHRDEQLEDIYAVED